MHRLWIRIRLPLAMVVLLVINLGMARLFSGPEDTWIKNSQGEWIKHGYPSGPPPPQDYKKPFSHQIVPFFFFIPIVVPLFYIKKYKPQHRLNFDKITSDIRYYVYIYTSFFLLGIIILIGLILEVDFSLIGNFQLQEFLVIISIVGFAGLCILISYIFFLLKRKRSNYLNLIKK